MRKSIIVVFLVGVVALAGMVGTMVGLNRTMGELAVEMGKNQVDAVLASANVADDMLVNVPVLYHKQVADGCVDLYNPALKAQLEARQFEWSKCGYYNKALEKELTSAELDAEYLPVGLGGNITSNRGLEGNNFYRWYHAVEGQSTAQAGTLAMRYTADIASFSYENSAFYPVGVGELFTMNLGLPVKITGEGKENFSILADDDTWVYVDNKIVLDMGGIHDGTKGRFKINETGEIYAAVGEESLAYSGVRVEPGANIVVRVFHANRDSGESVMQINLSNMLLNVVDTTLASDGGDGINSDGAITYNGNDGAAVYGGNDGAMVAYDPNNPSFIAPLGESVTYTPNRSGMMLDSVVTMAAVMGALSVVIMVTISVGWRIYQRQK